MSLRPAQRPSPIRPVFGSNEVEQRVTYELWIENKCFVAGWSEDALRTLIVHMGFNGIVYRTGGGDVTRAFHCG